MKRYSSTTVATLAMIAMLAISNTVDGLAMPSDVRVSAPITPFVGGKIRISVHRGEARAPGQQGALVLVGFTLLDANGNIMAQTDPDNPVPLPPTVTRFFDVPEPAAGWPGVGGPAPVVAVVSIVIPDGATLPYRALLTASVEAYFPGGNRDGYVSLVFGESDER